MLGWPKRCELARAFLWEHSGKRLELVQLLGQLGVFLTSWRVSMIFYVPGGKYELMLPPPTPPGQPMVTGVPNLVTVWRHLRLHPRG
jgi:hypothetical protein